MLQNDINENESLKKDFEQSIKQIQGKIMKILSDLQKNIFTFVDQQSQLLQTNKNKAQQVMQDSNQSLDIYIFFAKFSDNKAKEKQEITKQQVKAIMNDLIEDFNQKIEYFKQPDVNKYKIIEFELQSFQIESIFQKKLPYSYCAQHCSIKTSICINIQCLKSNNLDYHCLRCCKSSHIEDFQNDCLIEYERLKKDQKIKQKFVVNQKQKIKDNIQILVIGLINQLKIEQKEQYLKYEIALENIKSLQQQFEIDLSVQDTKYVFGDLLLQFIIANEEALQFQLNHAQKTCEEKLKCCRKIDNQIFIEECKLLQLKQDEIFNLEKNLKELKQVVDQKDQLLSKYSSENILNLIFKNLEELRGDKDEAKNLLKKNESLQKKNESLQKTNDSLQKTNDSLQKTNDSLKKTIDNFSKSLQQEQQKPITQKKALPSYKTSA